MIDAGLQSTLFILDGVSFPVIKPVVPIAIARITFLIRLKSSVLGSSFKL
jgi:hypothetical protein